jgi:hypothetical protein
MYELEREEHIATHSQLEEARHPLTSKLILALIVSPQALLNTERLEEDLRQAVSQLSDVRPPELYLQPKCLKSGHDRTIAGAARDAGVEAGVRPQPCALPNAHLLQSHEHKHNIDVQRSQQLESTISGLQVPQSVSHFKTLNPLQPRNRSVKLQTNPLLQAKYASPRTPKKLH